MLQTKKQKTQSWMKEYWEDFDAEDKYINDKSETCGAKLYYYTNNALTNEICVVGATGKAGHAEMHALSQFIKNVCKFDPAKLKQYITRGLRIECPAKSCCVRCSIVLGALDFSAVGGDYVKSATREVKRRRKIGNRTITKTFKRTFTFSCYGMTYKTEEKMGKTEWGLPPDVRTFLAAYLNLTEQNILDIGTLTGY